MPDISDNHRPAPSSRRKFFRRALGAGLLGAACVAVDQRGEADDLTVVRRTLPLRGWPPGTPPLTVGFLADFHCYNAHSVARTRRAAERLLAQKPDVVFLGGDYISDRVHPWAARAADALAPLNTVPGGIFCVLGNHDWINDKWQSVAADMVSAEIRRVGFHVLRNQAEPLTAWPGVWVVGLDDRYAQRQDLSAALAGVPEAACKLLLVHEPDYADEAPPGFAFQLSGHSHGGQIRVPGLPPLHVPKYSAHYPEGLEQGPHHPVYTTRGVGTTGPPVRLYCPPEITVLRLQAA